MLLTVLRHLDQSKRNRKVDMNLNKVILRTAVVAVIFVVGFVQQLQINRLQNESRSNIESLTDFQSSQVEFDKSVAEHVQYAYPKLESIDCGTVCCYNHKPYCKEASNNE